MHCYLKHCHFLRIQVCPPGKPWPINQVLQTISISSMVAISLSCLVIVLGQIRKATPAIPIYGTSVLLLCPPPPSPNCWIRSWQEARGCWELLLSYCDMFHYEVPSWKEKKCLCRSKSFRIRLHFWNDSRGRRSRLLSDGESH